jgi:uncharacterized membrane protein YukC
MLGLNVSYLKYILLGVLLYGLVLVVNNKLLANNEVQTDGFEEKKDSKLDTIVTKLDTIVTKLDNINDAINNSMNNEDDYVEDDEEDDEEDDDEEDDDEDNSGGTNVDGFKPKKNAKSSTQKKK